MNRIVLASTAAALALTAGGASAATGAKMLYSQNSNPAGLTIPSENFTDNSTAYNSAGADDFVVPAGRTWKVAQVDITGLYFNGSGGALSENVTFYRDRRGKPGKPVGGGTYTNLKGTDDDGSFAIALGRRTKLRAGTYWVSVAINGNGSFEWGWETTATVRGNEAMWENPGGGFGACPGWGTIGSCLGETGDLMFDLKGRG